MYRAETNQKKEEEATSRGKAQIKFTCTHIFIYIMNRKMFINKINI